MTLLLLLLLTVRALFDDAFLCPYFLVFLFLLRLNFEVGTSSDACGSNKVTCFPMIGSGKA